MGSKNADRKQAKKSYLQYHRVCPLESGLEVEELSLAPAIKPGQTWSDLPHPLLETIFSYAYEDQGGQQDARIGFILSSVCRSWRTAASSVFFKGPWTSGNAITHPAQLFQLCPLRLAPGGTMKCYLKREVVSGGLAGRLHRFILCQGSDYQNDNGKFLLAAMQQSKQRYALYLQRNMAGAPAARLVSNIMRTGYTLIPSSSGWVKALITGQQEQLLQQQLHQLHPQQQQDAPPGVLQLQPLLPVVSGSKRSSDQGYSGSSRDAACWDLPSMSGDSCSSSSIGGGPLEGSAAAAAGGDSWPLARVRYQLRVRGMMLPRSMSVRLPCPLHYQQQHHASSSTADRPDALLSRQVGGDQGSHSHPHHPHVHHDHHHHHHQQQQSLMGLSQSSWWAEGLPSSSSSSADGRRWPGSRRRRHLAAQQQQQQQHLCGLGTVGVAALSALPPCAVCGVSSRDPGDMKLRNKPPHWNEGLRCWCLNFRGRVKLASVKNFQLVAVAEGGTAADSSSRGGGGSAGGTHGGPAGRLPGAVVGSPATWGIAMQFGKVDTDLFILDYDPCLVSAVQAFAVALTTFETKLLL